MVLKELEIQGFKSFPDRTKVRIGQGITAVGGAQRFGQKQYFRRHPLGAGRNQLKQLRGAGKMEDVIFGGTQQRGAMGFAAVNLTVDNSDRRIDVDADEVVIGRKYYRSGESEYSVNGQNVRLKDIYELFWTRASGGTATRSSGRAALRKIVGAKSNERREILRRPAALPGTATAKRKAERRLASAEDNLARLRDILDELEARWGRWKRSKRQSSLELSARRKELEVTLGWTACAAPRIPVREQQRRYETAQADYDG